MAHRTKTWSLSAFFSLSVVAVAVACSSTSNRNTFGDPDPNGDAGGLGSGLQDGGGTISASSACVTESKRAELLPLDIYVMLDQSLSMNESVAGGTKWSAITGALTTFINQPSLAGVGVGIQFFGLPIGGKTCTTTCTSDAECSPGDPCTTVVGLGIKVCSSCLDSCASGAYAIPEVEIATLPGASAALTASIGAHKPSTLTPTSAALQGAVEHAKAWAEAHPGHITIALLATDGDPSECDLNLPSVNAIAAAGASGTPKVLTFVIGVGSSFTALDGIAKAGGTTSAYTIGTTGNVNQQFLDALNKVRGAAIGCQYSIPVPKNGEQLDLRAVNLEYTPSGKPARIIPKVATKAQCPSNGEGWYYDDNAAPKQILLCADVCSKIGGDVDGDVKVLIGCKTIVK